MRMEYIKSVVIVAGGSGMRFGAEVPKQFVELNGLPVLMRTINAFAKAIDNINIILVLPTDHIPYWQQLCLKYSFNINHQIAHAGATRYDSVRNGLALINHDIDNQLVAIHDGVRPLVTKKMIIDSFETAIIKGSAIPVIPVVDSIRRQLEDGSTEALERNSLMAVQTPQTFQWSLLREAYGKPYSNMFTDDASVVEGNGTTVCTYNGDIRNIKITHPIDLIIAAHYLKQ